MQLMQPYAPWKREQALLARITNMHEMQEMAVYEARLNFTFL